jgi:copper(I)-binding protein
MASWSLAAHEFWEGDVRISHPWAVPAKAGKNTRLYLVIENEEQARITLMNLATPVAKSARFQFQADAETVLSLSSRTIGSEETLNVASHHMWFELHDLRRDLIKGSTFPAVLTLADGRIIKFSVVVGRPDDAEQVGS